MYYKYLYSDLVLLLFDYVTFKCRVVLSDFVVWVRKTKYEICYSIYHICCIGSYMAKALGSTLLQMMHLFKNELK